MAKTSKPWRSFTIFVSSTFIDMAAERDYLNNIIARELEREYEKKRVALNFVDLRWGVQTDKKADKEARELSVLNVCMEEIKRSRPFFIALLGHRYGWIPSKERFIKMIEGMNCEERQLLKGGEGASVTALEILFGALGNDELLNRSLFYFRNSTSYSKMSQEELSLYQDNQHVEKLELLKKRIINECSKKGLDNVHTYCLEWHNGHFTGLEKWGEQVKNHLRREINAELKETASLVPTNWLEMENLQQEIFIHAQTQLFVGRKKELAEMENFVLKEHRVMVIAGHATTGKSSLLCQLYQRMQGISGLIVLLHCTNVSRYANYTYRMFCRLSVRLCMELGQPYTEPNDIGSEARNYFLDLVRKVTKNGLKVVLLIDSTDVFRPSDDASNYSWLPDEASCILTCRRTQDDSYVKEITRYKKNAQVMYLPFLQREEARIVVREQCRLFHKSIPESVLELIINKKADKQSLPKGYPKEYYACYNPLWLKLIVRLLVSLGENDFAEARQIIIDETDEEAKLEKYLCKCVQQVPIDPTNLIIKSFLPRLMQDVPSSLLYKLLISIALTAGLSETDMSILFGSEWNSLSFSKIRHYLKDILIEDYETGEWYYSHIHIAQSFISLLPADDYLKFTHILGNYYANSEYKGPDASRKAMYFLINGNRPTMAAYFCSSPYLEESDVEDIIEEIVENIKLDEEKYLPWFTSLFCLRNPDEDISKEQWIWMEEGGYERLYRIAIEYLLPRLEWLNKSWALQFAQGIEAVVKTFADNNPNNSNANCLLQKLYYYMANYYETINLPSLQRKYVEYLSDGRWNDTSDTNINIEEQARTALNEEDYPKAEQLYLSLYQTKKLRYKAAPNDSLTCYDVFMSCVYLMDVYRRWKHLDRMSAIVEEAFTYLPFIPTELRYQKTKGQFYHMAGRLYIELGYSKQALNLLEKSINILTAIHERNLQNDESTIELGIAYETLGAYYEAQNQLEHALDCYYKQADLFDEVLSVNTDNEICLHFRLIAACHIWDVLQSQNDTSNKWLDVNRDLVLLDRSVAPDLLTEHDLEHTASAYFFLGTIWKEQSLKERELSSQDMSDLLLEGWERLKEVFHFSYDSYYIELGLSCLYLRLEIAVNNNFPQEEPLKTLFQAYNTYPPSDSDLGLLISKQIEQIKITLEKKQDFPLIRAFQAGQYIQAIQYYQDKTSHTEHEQLLYALCLLRTDFRKKAAEAFISLRNKVQGNRDSWLLVTLNLSVCYLLEGNLYEFKNLFNELTDEEKTLDKSTFLWKAYLEKETLLTADSPWYKRLLKRPPSIKELRVTLPKPHGWIEL